jgi:predicted Na+-dependent transporter
MNGKLLMQICKVLVIPVFAGSLINEQLNALWEFKAGRRI